MDVREIEELEDPVTWADEGYVLPPAKNPGAIFAIDFTLLELQRLQAGADALGIRVIEFIRQLALENAVASPSELATPKVRRPASAQVVSQMQWRNFAELPITRVE